MDSFTRESYSSLKIHIFAIQALSYPNLIHPLFEHALTMLQAGETAVITDIPSCGAIGFTISQDGIGTPTIGPFTLHMYPVGGTPNALLIPDDNLFWQPSWAAGVSMLAELVDANGNSGGISPLWDIVRESPPHLIPGILHTRC
jgi:hypothetical protein